MDEKLEPYEDYFKNIVKPKVLKGEEETLDKKWKRLVPTAYREIIADKDKEIERLTAESTEWESKCYKYQDIINELEEELEREINFGKTIPKEADDYNSSLDIRHTLEKVLERLKELKEKK